MALNFPNSPADGATYIEPTTGILYTYKTADDSWTGAITGGSGGSAIDPAPADITATPDFVSGAGTEGDPYILTPATALDAGTVLESTQVITITAGNEGDPVIWQNISTGGGATRFNQPLAQISSAGTWVGTIRYTDVPTSTSGATYTGELKIGSSSVYLQWVVTQEVGIPLVQVAAPVVSGIPEVGETLTVVPGTAGGGEGTITHTNQWQITTGPASFQDIVGATELTYTIISGDIGKYIRCNTIATDSQGHTLALHSNSTPQIDNKLAPDIDTVALTQTNALVNYSEMVSNVYCVTTPESLNGNWDTADSNVNIYCSAPTDPGATYIMKFTIPPELQSTSSQTVTMITTAYGGGGWTTVAANIGGDGDTAPTQTYQNDVPSTNLRTNVITLGPNCTYFELPGSWSQAADSGNGGVIQNVRRVIWDGVLLLDNSDRFTNATFDAAITMIEEGAPASDRQLKAVAEGALSSHGETSAITAVDAPPATNATAMRSAATSASSMTWDTSSAMTLNLPDSLTTTANLTYMVSTAGCPAEGFSMTWYGNIPNIRYASSSSGSSNEISSGNLTNTMTINQTGLYTDGGNLISGVGYYRLYAGGSGSSTIVVTNVAGTVFSLTDTTDLNNGLFLIGDKVIPNPNPGVQTYIQIYDSSQNTTIPCTKTGATYRIAKQYVLDRSTFLTNQNGDAYVCTIGDFFAMPLEGSMNWFLFNTLTSCDSANAGTYNVTEERTPIQWKDLWINNGPAYDYCMLVCYGDNGGWTEGQDIMTCTYEGSIGTVQAVNSVAKTMTLNNIEGAGFVATSTIVNPTANPILFYPKTSDIVSASPTGTVETTTLTFTDNTDLETFGVSSTVTQEAPFTPITSAIVSVDTSAFANYYPKGILPLVAGEYSGTDYVWWLSSMNVSNQSDSMIYCTLQRSTDGGATFTTIATNFMGTAQTHDGGGWTANNWRSCSYGLIYDDSSDRLVCWVNGKDIRSKDNPPNNLYEGSWRYSDDGGFSWYPQSGPGSFAIGSITLDGLGTQIQVGADSNNSSSISRSSDGGATWTNVVGIGGQPFSTVIPYAGPGAAWIVARPSTSNLYVSFDNAQSFTNIYDTIPGTGILKEYMCASDTSGNILIQTLDSTNADDNNFYYRAAGQTAWVTKAAGAGSNRPMTANAMGYHSGRQKFTAIDADGIYWESTDGGTWTPNIITVNGWGDPINTNIAFQVGANDSSLTVAYSVNPVSGGAGSGRGTSTGATTTDLVVADVTQLNNLSTGDDITETGGDATGTILSVNTTTKTLSLSPSAGDWSVSSTVTGPALDGSGNVNSIDTIAKTMVVSSISSRFAIGTKVIGEGSATSSARLFGVLNAVGQISGLTSADPGFVTQTDSGNTQTITFPSSFSNGETPDQALPASTSFYVDVKVENNSGSDTQKSNTLIPGADALSALTLVNASKKAAAESLLVYEHEVQKSVMRSYSSRNSSIILNAAQAVRKAVQPGFVTSYDTSAYLAPKAVLKSAGVFWLINLEYAAANTVQVTVKATVNGGATPVSVTSTAVDRYVLYTNFIKNLIAAITDPSEFTVTATDNNTTITVAGTAGNTLTNITCTIA